MKLTFLGANRQVTGSCYVLEAGGMCVMVDHGLFQERPFLERNWHDCPFPPAKIDALLLTHAHIDHVGRLPKLVAEGFHGPVYATEPSVDLAEIVLKDAAKLQAEDAAYKKKRHAKEGRVGPHPERPLYTERDVHKTLKLLRGVLYRKPLKLNDRLSVTYHDAGHILGSAMLEVCAEGKRVVFSGDIGQPDKPLINDPAVLEHADWIVMESTYGDRDHGGKGNVEHALADVVNRTVAEGGRLIIPTFAVERAQELIYHFGRLVRAKLIPQLPVFLDSPMAVDVTSIFRKYHDWLDEPTRQLIEDGDAPLNFPGLKLCSSTDQSKAINAQRGPCIIMSPSGMCTGGRIKHHLARNIGNPKNTVLFVGFQGNGTLGRQIADGRPEVRIHGQLWPVRARIEKLDGFSAHADRLGLLRWLGEFRNPPQKLFLTHGEESASNALAVQMTREKNWNVCVPEYRQTVELL